MVAAADQQDDYPPPPSSRIRVPEAWDLEGDLEQLGLFAVLQFLESSRVDGVVLVIEPDGAYSHFMLCKGSVTAASFRSLRGREALLAILAIKRGTFGFVRRTTEPAADPITLGPVLMDAVRLEDELERMAPFLPPADLPLTLVDPHEFPIDPLECGADKVMVALSARPGTSLQYLESSLSLAPVKVSTSVAWLVHSGRIPHPDGAATVSSGRQLQASDWYGRLLLRHPGGLRLLLGTSPHEGPHDVISSIVALARDLDSVPAWMSVAPNGSSIARVRPRVGGLLSIASVPMVPANTEVFKRFASTATLALLCVDAPAELSATWRRECPAQVPLARLRCALRVGCVYQALREFANATEAPTASAP